MQKAGEPENDAGFPKHNYSQLNCSCYSYPSKPIMFIEVGGDEIVDNFFENFAGHRKKGDGSE